MHKPSDINTILQTGGFSFHSFIGRIFRVGFLAQCCIIAALAACALVVGSIIDDSLVLEGRNIGLLEHPGIWAFFGLQVALPLSIRNSLKRLLRARRRIHEVAKLDRGFSDLVVAPVVQFLRLQENESRAVATIVYSAGLFAFVWNTYQNQLPGIIIPYDFWDSKNYFFGFWLTRVYKLYLLVWLLPYIALIHLAVLIVTLRFIRQARISGRLKLIPFHPDGVGGLGFMPALVTTPIIVTLLLGSISTAAAFEVHRAADVTPLMGLTIIIVSTGIGYIVPILFLRSDIVAMKRLTIKKLRLLQQAYYTKIIDGRDLDFETVRNGNEAHDYFEKVCTNVQSISNYPHLRRLLRYIGLALTPSIISLVIKLYNDLVPIIGPLLKKS
jgi:hypothetical protein